MNWFLRLTGTRQFQESNEDAISDRLRLERDQIAGALSRILNTHDSPGSWRDEPTESGLAAHQQDTEIPTNELGTTSDMVSDLDRMIVRLETWIEELVKRHGELAASHDRLSTVLHERDRTIAQLSAATQSADQIKQFLSERLDQSDGAANASFAQLQAHIEASRSTLLEDLGTRSASRLGHANIVDLLDRHYRDLMVALTSKPDVSACPEVEIVTDHPIASDSVDHLHPRGTRKDNTRHPRFVTACERHFNRGLRVLDLGCAGGGMVLEFVLKGHDAFGIEGSDYSLVHQRAEWRLIGSRLFTADITKPFTLREAVSRDTLKFDIVTAWEVMEHIRESDIGALLENIRDHLAEDGLFMGSVAMFQDTDPETGHTYHPTTKPETFWMSRFKEHGLEPASHSFAVEDFPRGSGNGPDDTSLRSNPDLGFHFVTTPAASTR